MNNQTIREPFQQKAQSQTNYNQQLSNRQISQGAIYEGYSQSNQQQTYQLSYKSPEDLKHTIPGSHDLMSNQPQYYNDLQQPNQKVVY